MEVVAEINHVYKQTRTCVSTQGTISDRQGSAQPWFGSRADGAITYDTPSVWKPGTTTEQVICPGWKTHVVPDSQPGPPRRDKGGGLSTRVRDLGQKSTFGPC